MASFKAAMNIEDTLTWNGALSYGNPDEQKNYSSRLSLFFHACRGCNIPKLENMLEQCAKESVLDTFLLAFNIRDCRGGKGERHLGRHAFAWLATRFPEQFERVFPLIPEYGTWEDLLYLFPNVIKYFNADLHNKIVRFFANKLIEDRELMMEGKPVSLCAKWAPTEGDSLDRKYRLFELLAKTMEVSHKTLRKKYISPLRRYLKVIETLTCNKRWEEIDFSTVPSCAMKNLRKAFSKHVPEQFTLWLEKLKNKEVKVNAKQLYPHELIEECEKSKYDPVVQAQWNVLVEETNKLGTFTDSIVLCDVSGSMQGIPMRVSIALGILISTVTRPPWNNAVMTFESNPKFVVVPEGTLEQQYIAVRNAPWGGSTDLMAAFNLILRKAQASNLTQEEMPKRLYIISDMQFNSACGSSTNFDSVEKAYREAGYVRPEIVFWNVNGNISDFPTTNQKTGTVMISGFSPSILETITKTGITNSVSILMNEIGKQRYELVRNALA